MQVMRERNFLNPTMLDRIQKSLMQIRVDKVVELPEFQTFKSLIQNPWQNEDMKNLLRGNPISRGLGRSI